MTRITALRALVFIAFTATGSAVWADPVKIAAGSTSVFSPKAAQPCFVGVAERQTRALTEVNGDCVFESGALRAEAFATSGAGVLPVDVSAEVKVIVSHFQVDTAPGASATSYLPIQVSVPVSWAGRFFNSTAFPAAVASMNMYLRLRETDAADPNFAGALISQSRFQGASHGGISACLSVPTDGVSAATALVGCTLALFQKDEGSAFVQLSGVIKTNQPYSIELVARADLTVTPTGNPPQAVTPETVNFRDGFGMTWKDPALVRIGTDAEQVMGGIREELEALREELARLRHDFEGHYHTYLTGRGEGHNNTVAQTPPPVLPAPLPASGQGNATSSPPPSSTPIIGTPPGESFATNTERSASGGGGGSTGVPAVLMLAILAGLRLGRRRRGTPAALDRETCIATR